MTLKKTGKLSGSCSLKDQPQIVIEDVRKLICSSRERVAGAVNTELVLLYWNIGRRIKNEILREKGASYGDEIVATLSQQLLLEFGAGFSRYNLSCVVW